MLVVFPPIFVADTKIIYGYNFVAPLNTNVVIKSTNFHQESMQRHTESISFGLFLNLNIFGTPHLSELIF